MTCLNTIPTHIVNRYTGHMSTYSKYEIGYGTCDVVTVYLKYWIFTRKLKFKFSRSGAPLEGYDNVWNYTMTDSCKQFLMALSELEINDPAPKSTKPVNRKHLKVIK